MKTQYSIKRLSDKVINQIKAGEVIERPLNVVKELVENSIDAFATNIKIELLDGGKKLIQISDNGYGIAKDQISISTERHTTSKLETFEDLQTLSSFGFRGEALASISSVSKFQLKTKQKKDHIGTEAIFEPNLPLKTNDIVLNQGTIVSVKDLFYNVPVRLKFLKSTATEFALIHEFLRATALSLPQISFEFLHNGRKVFQYFSKETLKERFVEILQIESNDYVPVNFEHGLFKVSGFTILPSKIKSTQNSITTFVNNRFIKDKFLRSSIYAGYQGLLMKGVKPSALLFISINPKQIDTNAHPAKIEIRFLDPLVVQDLITRSIEDSLKSNIIQNLHSHKTDFQNYNQIYTSNKPQNFANELNTSHDSNTSNHSKHTFQSSLSASPHSSSFETRRYKNLSNLKNLRLPEVEQSYTHTAPYSKNEPLFIEKSTDNLFGNSTFLGQFLKCYLIFEKNTELFIVDQHALHERILFEELNTSFQTKKIQKQFFLNPIIFPIDSFVAHTFAEQKDFILSIGFAIEILKDNTIAVHSSPNFLNEKYIESIFSALSEKLVNLFQTSKTDLYHDCFATIACHSAVRAGDPLSAEFVLKLINRAEDVDFFAHCPHGRPVIRKFSQNDVERWFERI